MKTLRRGFLILLMTTGLLSASDSQAETTRQIIEDNRLAIMKVSYSISWDNPEFDDDEVECFGTVVDPSGLVLIAAEYVDIEEGQSGDFILSQGRVSYEGELVHKDLGRNIAIVRIGPEEGEEEEEIEEDRTFTSVSFVNRPLLMAEKLILIKRFGERQFYRICHYPLQILGTATKPKTISMTDGNKELEDATGLPVFDLKGQAVGMVSQRVGADAVGRPQTYGITGIIPVEGLDEILSEVKKKLKAREDSKDKN